MLRTIEEAQEALTQFVPPPRSQREKYTLDRMYQYMAFLGNPQDKVRVIHVAGTSGKTSTCYFISSILTEAGLKVGLTVSPHIDKVSERVQINGKPLEDKVFAQNLDEFIDLTQKSGINLTYFEVLIAFAYWYFARENVDVAVIETGLGGLFDGSNVVKSQEKFCVLTDIGLDHTEVLGDTLGEIAFQKAGIIQSGNTVFVHKQSSNVMAVFEKRCQEQKAQLHIVEDTVTAAFEDLPLFQRRNWSLAVSTATSWLQAYGFKIPATDSLKKAHEVIIPARMEVRRVGNKTVVLDGAHNPQKLEAFVASFRQKFPKTHPAVLFASIKSGPDRLNGNIAALKKLEPTSVVTTYFVSKQDMKKEAIDPADLAHELSRAGFSRVEAMPDATEALKCVLELPSDTIVITGSLYLIFVIRKLLS